MRESVRAALTAWARAAGEAADYTDNLPGQCLHPVGHWFEIPNLLKNGVLARLLAARPRLRTLLVHNIDTLGATVDPAAAGLVPRLGRDARLGGHGAAGRGPRRRPRAPRRPPAPRGGPGAPARGGRIRASPSTTRTPAGWTSTACWPFSGWAAATWPTPAKTAAAVRALAARMPTYVTLKDVKKRWGHGQEDVFPVAQFEKLWGDMTALPECANVFAVCAARPRPAAQGPGPARYLAARRLRRVYRIAR